ncbi:MAG: SMC-Scp complex subunit ScpB [Treponemataceae bacterium]|nr:SMC-Scp complex subunit ScpB [Treponemataceae bacterium]
MEIDLTKETAVVEAVLFLDSEPLSEDAISKISELSIDVVQIAIENLKEKYSNENSGIELSKITGGWVLTPKKEIWDTLKEHYGKKSEGKLSKAAMETLSIIAYSQPITRSEIEDIRGVSADNMIRFLVERNLIKEVGKKDAPGRPTQFGTTKEFLKFFRLNSISELPKLEEKESERFELAR